MHLSHFVSYVLASQGAKNFLGSKLRVGPGRLGEATGLGQGRPPLGPTSATSRPASFPRLPAPPPGLGRGVVARRWEKSPRGGPTRGGRPPLAFRDRHRAGRDRRAIAVREDPIR